MKTKYDIPSYKLDVLLEPWWFKLYKIASGEKSEEKLSKEIREKEGRSKEMDSDLYRRRYRFTEYYDSATGVTIRFQRTFLPSGRENFYTVDDFEDEGFFFDSDYQKMQNLISNEEKFDETYQLEKTEIDKFFLNIHDGVIHLRDESLFFPLDEIFTFLLAIGKRFPGLEKNMVLKWPDHYEKKFKKLGIKHERVSDYVPDQFEIQRQDKEFFEEWGNPEISLSPQGNMFKSEKDGTNFTINLKIFWPEENDRVII